MALVDQVSTKQENKQEKQNTHTQVGETVAG